MELVARTTLEDCRVARSNIDGQIQGSQWRVNWIAAVALLRAVGHVLKHQADVCGDPILEKIINDKWDQPKPDIYREFIEKERNNILKEYQINAGQGVTVRPGWGETTRDYTINRGYGAGSDQREVLKDAIDWWDQYLSQIENQYSQQSGKS